MTAKNPNSSAEGRTVSEPHAQLGRGAQVASLAAGIAIVAFAVVYLVGCIFFYDRFWPNTRIGDADVSGMVRSTAVDSVKNASQVRSVTVSGQGVSFTLDGATAGLEINSDVAVDDALSHGASWQWPIQIFMDHDESESASASFDQDLLRSVIERSVSGFNDIAVAPSDAFLYFDELTGRFEINPGSMGTKLDVDSVMQTVMDAMTSRSAYAALTSVNLVQQNVKSDDPALIQARDTANSYLGCNLDLTLNGTVVATVGPAVVKDWLVFPGDGSVYLDDASLVAWVDGIEGLVDSVGSTRSYYRGDGKYCTVTGGNYGWVSDGVALEQMVRDAVTYAQTGSESVPTRQNAVTYNPGGADWQGVRYIDVDISEQHAYFFDEAGNIMWETDCITGWYNWHDTPQGVYSIYSKQRDTVLLGFPDENGKPEYESPVSYWMPFNEGVGLHDATWQWDFGGTYYMQGMGSHGCVNLPLDMAAALYDICSIGDVVVVHY